MGGRTTSSTVFKGLVNRARRETRETSIEAHDHVVETGKDGKLQRAVLGVLSDGDMWSTRELAHELRGEIDNMRSISPRMAELKRAGKVIDSGRKMCSISHRRVIGWQLAPEGTPPAPPRPRKATRAQLVDMLVTLVAKANAGEVPGADTIVSVERALEAEGS